MKKYFSEDDLIQMQKNANEVCISLYLPTPRASIDNRENFIRLKNKLVEIETRLLELHVDKEEIQKFLSLAKQMFKDNVATGNLDQSMAIFFTNDQLNCYTLPMIFDEKIDVGSTFYLDPLMQFLKNKEKKYYILMLNQNKISLYQANPYEMEEIPLTKVPTSIQAFFSDEEFSSTLQFRSSTSQGKTNHMAIFSSSGDKKSEDKKNQLQRYFLKVNEAVVSILHGQKAPLVLVGVDYLFPIYKNVNSYPYLVDKGLKGNPTTLKKATIHDETLKIVNLK